MALAESQSGESSGESSPQVSSAALADMLANEQTRNELIEQLRAIASGETPSSKGGAEQTPTQESDPPASLGGQIAEITQSFAGEVGDTVSNAVAAFRSAGSGEGAGLPWAQWSRILIAFAFAAISTVAAFFILRALVSPLYSRFDRWAGAAPAPIDTATGESPRAATDKDDTALADSVRPMAGADDSERLEERERKRNATAAGALFKRCAVVVGALIIDVSLVLLAGAVGYMVSLFFSGETGEVGRTESLFINAFVMVEVVKALIRMVFSTRYDSLRLFDMHRDTAARWNCWLAIVVGVTGYGLLVAVPMVNAMLSPAAGQLLSLVIMLVVYIYAVRFIVKHRATLRDALDARADRTNLAFFGTLLRLLGRVWHLLAIAYFTVLLLVSQLQPAEALPFMAHATLQTLLAIGIGILLSSLLSIALVRRIRLSATLRERLPMLENRVNSYVPKALRGLRILLGIFVVLAVLDAWSVFDLPGWLASDSGALVISMIVHVAIILGIATLIWTVVASFIEHRLSAASAPSAREQTLLSLFRNAVLILIVTMTLLIVLSQIGINIGPLIAGAGVIGLAIGFGAQKLVQDIITGVFIQLENAMNTGDVVGVAGLTGTAEKITIRSVGLRALNGTYHVIPFSSVDTVSNYMRDFAYHVGEYGIAYRENVDDAIHHLHQAFAELMEDEEQKDNILEEMTVPGVIALADSSVNIRIMIKVKPGTQWGVGRAFNRLVKKHFDAAGIEIPFPHTTLFFGQEKDGSAPPARVRMFDERTIEGEQAEDDSAASAVASDAEASRRDDRRRSDERKLSDHEKKPDADNDDAGDGGDAPR